MKELFANNAASVMVGTLPQGSTSLNVTAGTGSLFPTPGAGEFFRLTLFKKDGSGVEFDYEIVRVTARSTDNMTIERDVEGLVGEAGGRAYDGTTDTVYVQNRHTAGAADGMMQRDEWALLSSKNPPVDGDSLALWDSVASALKRLTWANAKAALKSYFDTLYALASQGVTNGNSHNHTGGAGGQIAYSSLSGTPSLGALAAKSTVATADLDNSAVTYAKMQNVSATDRLLGRSSAGAGVVQEVVCTPFARTLLDDDNNTAARTTLGLGTAAVEPATAFMRASAVADLEMNNYRVFELKTAAFNAEFDAGNSGTSKTINWADGQCQKLTLTGNVTITFNWAGCGVGRYQLKLIQDATGSRTAAWSTGTPGASRWLESAAAPAHKATANSETIVTVYYDGTNAYGSMGKVGG